MPWRRDLYRSKVDRHFEVCAESSTFFREPPGDHERASLRLPDLILPVRGMQRQEAKGLDPGRAVLTVQEKSHGEVRGSRVISARRGTHECQGAGTGQERSLLRKWPMKDNLYTVGSWKCSDGICRALLAVGASMAHHVVAQLWNTGQKSAPTKPAPAKGTNKKCPRQRARPRGQIRQDFLALPGVPLPVAGV